MVCIVATEGRQPCEDRDRGCGYTMPRNLRLPEAGRGKKGCEQAWPCQHFYLID